MLCRLCGLGKSEEKEAAEGKLEAVTLERCREKGGQKYRKRVPFFVDTNPTVGYYAGLTF